MSNETTYISMHESFTLHVYREGVAHPKQSDFWTARIQGQVIDVTGTNEMIVDVKSSADTKKRAIERVILDTFGVGERKDWM